MAAEKRTEEELLDLLNQCPAAGTAYRHYKTGNLYWIQGSAIAEATQEPLVMYHRQSSGLIFARPLREWNEVVEWEGRQVPRFRLA